MSKKQALAIHSYSGYFLEKLYQILPFVLSSWMFEKVMQWTVKKSHYLKVTFSLIFPSAYLRSGFSYTPSNTRRPNWSKWTRTSIFARRTNWTWRTLGSIRERRNVLQHLITKKQFTSNIFSGSNTIICVYYKTFKNHPFTSSLKVRRQFQCWCSEVNHLHEQTLDQTYTFFL